MKLTEFKSETNHYFEDEQGRMQGEYKSWYDNGQRCVATNFRDGKFHGEYRNWWSSGKPWEMSHYKDNKLHGEIKTWTMSGELEIHKFYIDGEIIMNFIRDPELYPSTPEEKTMFALKYGNTPFIGDK